jgi:hypothetical protein
MLNVLATPIALKRMRRLHARVRALAWGHAAVVAFWAASLLWVAATGEAASWRAASGGVLFIPLLGLMLLTTRGISRVDWRVAARGAWMMRRLTIYGALPLIIIVGSLFPEIGEPIL